MFIDDNMFYTLSIVFKALVTIIATKIVYNILTKTIILIKIIWQ